MKNQTTTGGTNAVVALSDATVGTTTTQLTLKETMGYTGTTVTATSGALNDNFSYGLNTSHTDGVSSSGAYAAFQHPFVAVTGSYSTGGGTQQTGLSLSGGLVGHSGGLTLSPSLGETFGIVEVPQGQGASLLGSQAQVNGYGYAVVPYLSPY